MVALVRIFLSLGIMFYAFWFPRRYDRQLGIVTEWHYTHGLNWRQWLAVGCIILPGLCGLLCIAPYGAWSSLYNARQAEEIYQARFDLPEEQRSRVSNQAYDDMNAGYMQCWGFCCLLPIFSLILMGLAYPRHIRRFQSTDPQRVAHALKKAQVYQIYVPASQAWQPDQALNLVESLLRLFGSAVLRIRADQHGIYWEIVDVFWQADPKVVEQNIRSIYVEAQIEVKPLSDLPTLTTGYRYLAYYTHPNMFPAPLQTIHAFKQTTPLVTLAQTLSELSAGEQVTYYLIIAKDAPDAYRYGQHIITQWNFHPLQLLSNQGINDVLRKRLTGRDRTARFTHPDQRIFEEKLGQSLYRAILMLEVEAPTREQVITRLGLVDTPLGQMTRMPYNILQLVQRPLEQYIEPCSANQIPALRVYAEMVAANYRLRGQPPPLILDPRELAALWHLPAETFTAPNIRWLKGKMVKLPPELLQIAQQGDPSQIIKLGSGTYQGREAGVYISPQDRRTHLNIFGKTGMGKSTLLHNLAHQDIARGAGVAVIDPHGNLIADLLMSSIPPERENDVVILDLNNRDYPPPLNPMSSVKNDVDGLIVNALDHLFDGIEQYVRVSKYVRAAVGIAQLDDQPTMRDLSRVFTDTAFRDRLLGLNENPYVEDVWEEYKRTKEPQQRQYYEPILSRLGPFYGNKVLYPILCHPNALNFRQLIQQKKIILVSLSMSEEEVPNVERNLIGSLLISQLQIAGMQQTNDPFFIYIDEVQRFVTTSLSTLFSEARKYGLSLTVANQYLHQLDGQTLEAVMGTAGATIVFRCSPSDAKAVGAHLRPQFSTEDIVNLDQFMAAVKLQHTGRTLPAFTLNTVPAPPLPSDGQQRAERIRQKSIQNYTPKSRAEIMAFLAKRYPRRGGPQADDEENFYE